MKTLQLLGLLLVFTISSKAQLNVNDRWYYTYYNTFPQSHFEVAYCDITGDTLIEGKTCLRLQFSKGAGCAMMGSEFIRQENNRMYSWNRDKSRFDLLYDFNLNAGQSYNLVTTYENAKITIDSTSVINVNGSTRKVQFVSSNNPQLEFYGAIIEGIGNTRFLYPGNGVCDPFNYAGLRCFDDGTNTFHYSTGDCALYSSIADKSLPTLNISPNPFCDKLEIATSTEHNEIFILDLNGKVVFQQNMTGRAVQLDLKELASGAYLLKVLNASGESYQKLIKQ